MTATGVVAKVRTCRVCGCTDERACMTIEGPCYWVAEDLCSACAFNLPRLAITDMDALRDMLPVSLELTGGQWFAVLATIQLACRHPNFTGPTRAVVEGLAQAIQGIVSLTPNLARVAAAGWDPAADVPHEKRTEGG